MKKKSKMKRNICDLKYKDIALDWIKNNYNNIQGIYGKYYPDASEDSLKAEPYRMLDSVRFKLALDEVYREIKLEDLNIARKVLLSLYKEMTTAEKSSDRQNAAVWLGKSKAMFTERTEIQGDMTLNAQQEKKIEEYISNRLGDN